VISRTRHWPSSLAYLPWCAPAAGRSQIALLIDDGQLGNDARSLVAMKTALPTPFIAALWHEASGSWLLVDKTNTKGPPRLRPK
jgi:hypothetical protein